MFRLFTQRKYLSRLSLAMGFATLAGGAWAQETGAIDTGDTAWMLVATALVLLMTPGLAFFYGGLVRNKNVLGTMMQSISAMGLASVIWVVIGFTLCFGPSMGVVGGFDHLLLRGVGQEAWDGLTIPGLLFMAFQGMFAIITPAIIGGAVAERMKFKAYLWFIGLWLIFVYAPLCHWVWGNSESWLHHLLGSGIDFAGGTVVHISSGVSGLVACLVMGRRREFPKEAILPHNLPFVILGGGLLWFGWFGFNAGSELAADGVAANALVVTHVSAACGALTWLLYDWLRFGKPTALGTISGAVAGLVGITPGAGSVAVWGAIPVGILTAFVCVNFVHWRTRRGIDDSLDAFGVHGIGGMVGALLTGFFATSAVNPSLSGLFDGNPMQVVYQIKDIIVTIIFAGGMSWIILKVLNAVMGLRLNDEEEMIGLDQTQHGETGYSLQ